MKSGFGMVRDGKAYLISTILIVQVTEDSITGGVISSNILNPPRVFNSDDETMVFMDHFTSTSFDDMDW